MPNEDLTNVPAYVQPVRNTRPVLYGYVSNVTEDDCNGRMPCVRETDDKAPMLGYVSFSESVEEKAMRKLDAVGIAVLPPAHLTDFLLQIGYTDLNKESLSSVEMLVCMALLDDSFWIERAYHNIGEMQGCSMDAVRTKLTYQFKRHYDKARAQIEALCGITPSAHFEGNKLFVITLGYAYSKFCEQKGLSLF